MTCSLQSRERSFRPVELLPGRQPSSIVLFAQFHSIFFQREGEYHEHSPKEAAFNGRLSTEGTDREEKNTFPGRFFLLSPPGCVSVTIRTGTALVGRSYCALEVTMKGLLAGVLLRFLFLLSYVVPARNHSWKKNMAQ